MLKLLVVAIPWIVGAYFAGIGSHIWWISFLKKKETKLRVRIERQTLEEFPTETLAEELFEREEAWDVVTEHAEKKNDN